MCHEIHQSSLETRQPRQVWFLFHTPAEAGLGSVHGSDLALRKETRSASFNSQKGERLLGLDKWRSSVDLLRSMIVLGCVCVWKKFLLFLKCPNCLQIFHELLRGLVTRTKFRNSWIVKKKKQQRGKKTRRKEWYVYNKESLEVTVTSLFIISSLHWSLLRLCTQLALPHYIFRNA